MRWFNKRTSLVNGAVFKLEEYDTMEVFRGESKSVFKTKELESIVLEQIGTVVVSTKSRETRLLLFDYVSFKTDNQKAGLFITKIDKSQWLKD